MKPRRHEKHKFFIAEFTEVAEVKENKTLLRVLGVLCGKISLLNFVFSFISCFRGNLVRGKI